MQHNKWPFSLSLLFLLVLTNFTGALAAFRFSEAIPVQHNPWQITMTHESSSPNILVPGEDNPDWPFNGIRSYTFAGDVNGDVLSQNGPFGDGAFGFPLGVATSTTVGDIYVSFLNENELKFHNGNGPEGVSVPFGNVLNPRGIFWKANKLYVTDSDSNTVQIYDAPPHTVPVLSNPGFVGDNESITTPWAVAVDASGNVFVADNAEVKIEKYTPDGHGGYTASEFASHFTSAGMPSPPTGVALDKDGNVYVLIQGNDENENKGTVLKYDAARTLLETLSPQDPESGMLASPQMGIFVTDSYDLYVTSSSSDQIMHFTQLLFPPETPEASLVSTSSVQLSWTNHPDSQLRSETIRRSTTGFPVSADAGTAVTSNISPSITTYLDPAVGPGTFYYSFFSKDANGNYSEASTASITIPHTATPNTVSNLTAAPSGNTVALSWTNPTDGEFASWQIVRKLDSYAESLTAGTTVNASTTGNQYVDSTLADGTYYYSVFVIGLSGKISAPATQNAIVNTVAPTPSVEEETPTSDPEPEAETPTPDISTPPSTPSAPEPTFTQTGTTGSQEILSVLQSDLILPNVTIGNTSSATVQLTGGTLSSQTGLIGNANGDTGIVEIVGANTRWLNSSDLIIGKQGSGRLVQSAGVVQVEGTLMLARDTLSTGIYQLTGGTLQADTISIGQGTATLTWSGGTILAKTINSDLISEGTGTLSMPSGANSITISGQYTASLSGALNLSLSATNLNRNPSPITTSGISASSIRAQDIFGIYALNVGKAFQINGSLNFTLNINYAPKSGDTFLVIKAQSTSGQFSSLNLPTLPSGLSWDTSNLYTNGTLRIQESGASLLVGKVLNYPNPFKKSQSTTLGYRLSQNADIEVRVYSLRGTLMQSKNYPAGSDGGLSGYNTVQINPSSFEYPLSADVYVVVLLSQGKVLGKSKMAILP